MAQTPEEKKLAAKRHRLMTLYRITPEEKDAVEQFQKRTDTWGDYGILLTKGDGSFDAQVFLDHRHSDGKIRGCLSYLINKALGILEIGYKDRTPQVLRALAYYLDYPPFPIVHGSDRYGMIGKAKLNKKKKIYGSPNGPIKPPKKAKV